MNILPSSSAGFKCSLRARRLFIFLSVFAIIPAIAGNNFLCAAQDLPATQPDVTLVPQFQVDPPEETSVQGSRKKSGCSDTSAPCISQKSPNDSQTNQNASQPQSNSAGK